MRTNEGYIDACAHPPSALIDAGEEENVEPPKKKLRSACKYRALNDAAKLGTRICVFCQVSMLHSNVFMPGVKLKNLVFFIWEQVLIHVPILEQQVVGDAIVSDVRRYLLRCTPESLVCARCKQARLVFLTHKAYGWEVGAQRARDLNFLPKPLEHYMNRWGIDDDERQVVFCT